jgi:hypothetical protein
MGINEIDHTIHPYTVGREDCKVLPKSPPNARRYQLNPQ